MAFSAPASRRELAEINITPLVDVMLVLLVIFMVTAPMLSRPIETILPQRVINPPPQVREPPPPIDLRIESDNTVYWNNSPTNVADLQRKMEDEVQRDPTNQPELRIEANSEAHYEVMAKVLAAAKNAQMMKIGFVQ